MTSTTKSRTRAAGGSAAAKPRAAAKPAPPAGPGRGGARAGAGRKSVVEQPAMLPLIRIEAATKSRLEEIAASQELTLSAFVRQVLEREAKRKR